MKDVIYLRDEFDAYLLEHNRGIIIKTPGRPWNASTIQLFQTLTELGWTFYNDGEDVPLDSELDEEEHSDYASPWDYDD